MVTRARSPAAVKVRAAALSHYLEVAQSLALDPLPLLRAAGISKAWLAVPDHPIPADAVVNLLEASAHASGCETFALRMAGARQLSDFGVLSLLISHQRTLRDVLATMMQYRDVLNESLALDIETTGRVSILREEILTRSPLARQANELAMAVLFRLCRSVGGERWQPQSVHFTHPAPADGREHRRFFRCKLEFEADFNCIVCATADLDLPNPLADPMMADYAERFVSALPAAQAGSIVGDVRRSIYLLLPLGRATVVQIAQSLGLNVRTLQRRLDEEGLRFGELVQEVRRELAPRYIGNPRYPMARIAQQLGYAQPSSFTRWFSAEFGVPPLRWRECELVRRPQEKSRRRMPAA
jgi:AraC-like DNA-binding protein